jgi:hypothetical protein
VNRKIFSLVMVVVIFVMNVVASFAQVTLTIDTDPIFTSANTWITTFTPIVAIGIGISIALAILTFVGNKIVQAFRN